MREQGPDFMPAWGYLSGLQFGLSPSETIPNGFQK
jgi:hypothetical protein